MATREQRREIYNIVNDELSGSLLDVGTPLDDHAGRVLELINSYKERIAELERENEQIADENAYLEEEVRKLKKEPVTA